MTPSRKHIGRSLARRQGLSFATASWQNPLFRNRILGVVRRTITEEARGLCSTLNVCSLRSMNIDLESVAKFDWESLYAELSTRAPVLFSMLEAVLRRNAVKDQPRSKAVLCTAASILLHHRNEKLSLIQIIVSVVLYAGHSSKRVSVPSCSVVFVPTHAIAIV